VLTASDFALILSLGLLETLNVDKGFHIQGEFLEAWCEKNLGGFASDPDEKKTLSRAARRAPVGRCI
jgi:hypothetical protein